MTAGSRANNRHLPGRGFVILILQTHDEVVAQAMIEIHIVDHRDVARRPSLKADVREKVVSLDVPPANDDVGGPPRSLVPTVQGQVPTLHDGRES